MDLRSLFHPSVADWFENRFARATAAQAVEIVGDGLPADDGHGALRRPVAASLRLRGGRLQESHAPLASVSASGPAVMRR